MLLSDAKFRQSLHEMRRSEEMCDVQILVENACFSTHKLILAACSPYFRAMFRANNFDESTSKEIRIDPRVRHLGSKYVRFVVTNWVYSRWAFSADLQ